MKPRLELVTIPPGCSVRVYNRRIREIPFEWHHHPEYELTLTLNSRGLRFIGDHVGSYESTDLVLIPPDMPHTWASNSAIDESSPHQAIVIWFKEKWASEIANLCPEYAAIAQLLRNSRSALCFGSAEAKAMLKMMPELLSDSPSARLNAVLAVLTALSEAEGVPLASVVKSGRSNQGGWPQLDRVLNALHSRYSEPIAIRELCAIGNMSPRTLHRAFRSRLGENVTDYLRKLRAGHACMLLVETDLPISLIAGRAGFFSLSNFNRSFLRERRMTPSELRRFTRRHGQMPKLSVGTEAEDSERSFILQRDKLRQVHPQRPDCLRQSA